ncbi:MAG TPA: hypothetical protein VIK76_14615 [Pyrinomonadaceae bacterium]
MKLITLLFTFLLGATAAFAQGSPGIVGNYEGSLKGQAVTLEVKNTDGKLGGRLKNGEKSYELTDVAVNGEGTLSLTFGKDGKLDGKTDGTKITGNWIAGAEKSPIELKRVAAAEAPAPTAVPEAAGAVNLNGDWEAVADANGQPFPFLLTLKIEGERVTGGSSSQLGEASIKEGVWKDGKLSFQLEGTNGTITMSATVVEGKLSGEFDYAGQLSGKWVAVRKNP